jgi:hypothetical protein
MMRSITAALSLLAFEAPVHEQVHEAAAGASLVTVNANAPSSASLRPVEWGHDPFQTPLAIAR